MPEFLRFKGVLTKRGLFQGGLLLILLQVGATAAFIGSFFAMMEELPNAISVALLFGSGVLQTVLLVLAFWIVLAAVIKLARRREWGA